MKRIERVSLDTARLLLNFSGSSLSATLAEVQLEGAVAIHNILAREGFAYLADEVGMGKTYVALGVAAILRFFNPGVRVLYIAPRENIQKKWIKELRNFTRNNWLHVDQRVKSFQKAPAVNFVACHNLEDWGRQAVRNPNRDFFLRLTSFSFPLPSDSDKWRLKRDGLKSIAPVVEGAPFDLRNKEEFKRTYARTINMLLPHYDLVIIDEAHNLRHGRESHASRNRMLASVLGNDPDVDSLEWPYYGCRFDRVLLLSATPLETDYAEIWRQLDIFGFGTRVKELQNPDKDDSIKRELVKRFMIRRLNNLRIGGTPYTKNMYRREWRGGGCQTYDKPLEVPDDRQRLVVALVQKKVAEVINSPHFNASFQIGMLASFESFLQTAKVKEVGEEETVFDQTEQTEDELEKEGADRRTINRLAYSYRRKFGQPLPHPKMDAIVKQLKSRFESGEKTLVFVRRVKSVSELKEKLCREYDIWLKAQLEQKLPSKFHAEIERVWQKYEIERLESGRASEKGKINVSFEVSEPEVEDEWMDKQDELQDDEGGLDTFFSWFFRGDGPPDEPLSGSAFRKNRLQGEGSSYSIFFEDNYVSDLLGCTENVIEELARSLNLTQDALAEKLRILAFSVFIGPVRQQKFPRLKVFRAYQLAALFLLADSDAECTEGAKTVLRHRFGARVPRSATRVSDKFPNAVEFIETKTFFTELRRRRNIKDALWPEPDDTSFHERFINRERRRELLATVARLGHAFVDLWALFVTHVGVHSLRTRTRSDEQRAEELITKFLDLLEQQSREPKFNAYRELSEVSQNFDLIFDVNFPESGNIPLNTLSRLFSSTLRGQTPIGGMSGEVNTNLVKQFRMPGYPLVLITTDVLQEGEDLHTFCAEVIHYGISWTPSAMEQRTGRVDRIGSLTYRRLDNQPYAHAEEMLQVYYPYLADTVEVLQVERVFERMNRFIRMIHHTIGEEENESRLYTLTEFIRTRRKVEQIKSPLQSAFPVQSGNLVGSQEFPGQLLNTVTQTLNHLQIIKIYLEENVRIEWEEQPDSSALYGTVFIDEGKLLKPGDDRTPTLRGVRQQPFALFLHAAGMDSLILLHGISPVGEIPDQTDEATELVYLSAGLRGVKLCEVTAEEADSYTLTTEGDIIFTPDLTQPEEVLDLLSRITIAADQVEGCYFQWLDAPFSQFSKDLQREGRRNASD